MIAKLSVRKPGSSSLHANNILARMKIRAYGSKAYNNNNNNNDLLVIHPQSGSSLTKCANTITLYTKFYKLFMSISTVYNYI